MTSDRLDQEFGSEGKLLANPCDERSVGSTKLNATALEL
jgi:hypothetical protein